jgi:hypothetical protein
MGGLCVFARHKKNLATKIASKKARNNSLPDLRVVSCNLVVPIKASTTKQTERHETIA